MPRETVILGLLVIPACAGMTNLSSSLTKQSWQPLYKDCKAGAAFVRRWSGEAKGRYPTIRRGEATGGRDPESAPKPKVVLEVGGKKCKVGSIEIGPKKELFKRPVFKIVGGKLSRSSQVPRVFFVDVPAYDSAEQLIPDPELMESTT